MALLTQNSELRPHRIWNFTLPAWRVELSDGTRFNTCPSAGICAQYCYARNGTYRFSNVLAAHTAKLERVLREPRAWADEMIHELEHRRYRPTGIPRTLPIAIDDIDSTLVEWVESGGAAIRIHDAGDFFSDWYLDLWIEIAERFPAILFYAYTKEVTLLKRYAAEGRIPSNLRYLFSTGGIEDHLIDPDIDRHADVFPTDEALAAAGYISQDASDLLAILLPTTRIGIPANNIPHYNKRLNGRRFSDAVPANIRIRAKS